MEVTGYTAGGAIRATFDGVAIDVPDDMGNRHRRQIAEWEAEGNTIPAYVAPAPTEADVRAYAARKLEAIGAPYSPAERETWAPQVAEAERYLAADPGTEPAAPILTALAAARGLTVLQMATLVIDKRDTYAAASGAILAAQSTLLAMDPIPADYAADTRWP